ncbi:glutamate decarboxylase [Neoconidiobolus thromboides FSU 785]|nr:glutamate decarboxylase [Neoconidiobolus thromboides FSU 785]
MPLAGQVKADEVLEKAREKRVVDKGSKLQNFAYASRYQAREIPKFRMPEEGVDPKAAYRIVHDEMMLDGKPELNCATFLTGWMEPEADQLIQENINKNFVDADGFPSSMILHERCISMLANLWKVPNGSQAIGTVCGGSSEGVILGGLAMKWAWKQRMKDAGKDVSKPNVVFGANAHACIEKFARFFDVEARIVPVKKEHNFVMNAKDCVKFIDENTIGVYSILGSTYTGHYEDVEALSKELDDYEKKTGIHVPIHVDGASGAFVAPFATPDLKWSFDLPRVVSINASGHKYGLVYAGLGWVVWKNKDLLHKDLIFEMHYLGVTEYSFSLNFSRPSSHLIAQYYNFIRLGKEGYKRIMLDNLHNARYLSRALEQSGYFSVVSDVHRLKGKHGIEAENDTKSYKIEQLNVGLPLVAFKLSEKFLKEFPHISVSDVSGLARTKGWLIPNYNLPKDCEDTKILRIVVKESFSEEIIDRLVEDIIAAVNTLQVKCANGNGLIATNQSGHPSDSIFEIMGEMSNDSPFLTKKFEVSASKRKASKKSNDEKPKPKRSNTFSSVC